VRFSRGNRNRNNCETDEREREREKEWEGAYVSAAANQRPLPTKAKRKDSRLTAELALSYCAIPKRDLGQPTSIYEHLARCDHARCNELRDFRRPDDWSLFFVLFLTKVFFWVQQLPYCPG
jgi:hypothetical protein